MRLKKILLKFSIIDYMHLIFILLIFIFSTLLIKFQLYLNKILSSVYSIISEELTKFCIFLFYIIFCIIVNKIDFNNIELKRIEKVSDIKKDINYKKLAILRTFIFFPSVYYTFIYLPIILSSSFGLYNICFDIFEILKYKNIYIVKPDLTILISLKFITSINTTLIYLIFGVKKRFIYIFSIIICVLYRIFMLYLTGISSFGALYIFFSIFNIIFLIILIFISINQNIRRSVYAE